MPKRQEEAVAQEAEQKAPATRASRRTAPEAPKEEVKAEAPATTKKLPLTEKVKKWIAGISESASENIYEVLERVVEDDEKNKNNVCFITFSDPAGEEVDDVQNEYNIKEILFGYHTIPEKKPSGKVMLVEVLTPEEGSNEPYILVVQEV